MGDGGSGGDPRGYAQNPRSRLGKLLRINVNVSPVRVRIYAKGLRNPWRFSFDRRTGALWIGDVGQGAREEIDYLRPGRKPGANFGWNGYEGTLVYDSSTAARLKRGALTFPVSQYGRDLGYSVTGGYVYRGSAVPALRGFYLFGDFGSGHVWAKRGPGADRHLVQGADGEVTPALVVRARTRAASSTSRRSPAPSSRSCRSPPPRRPARGHPPSLRCR